jgi:geranylgeranyl diphosphate synthase type I
MTRQTKVVSFSAQMADYKKQIDADIDRYAKFFRTSTEAQFGGSSQPAVRAFTDVLTGGGKRLRGTLTIVGYELCGGTNKAMILQAARAMEMLHASLLLFDDIQDRSDIRHGKPAAHKRLAEAYKDEHLGGAIAMNAGLLGSYAAEGILSNLDAPAELRANTVSITNRTLLATVHGQSADMLGGTSSEQISLWKTAQYTVLNPLHVGMVMAGADCHATDAITPYALALGQAYQIKNDIAGVFGTNNTAAPMDDIREGKRTLLTEYALENTNATNKASLQKALGNQQLTPAAFSRCQEILKDCGALDHAQEQLKKHQTAALEALNNCDYHWIGRGEELLEQLTQLA